MDRRCRRLLALLALLAAPGRSRDSQRPLDDASAAAEGPLLPGPTCSGLLEALPSQQLRVEGQEEAPHAPPASRDPPQVGLEGGGRLGQAAAAAAGRFVEEPDAGETRVSDTPQPGLAVGNSGLDFSRLGDLLPQGQSTAKTLKTLLLGSAEPPGITWHRPLPSSRASAFPTGLQPTLPTSSAVLEASRDEMVSWLTDVEESSEESSPGTTARRMQFPAGEAGRTGSAEPPNAAGASGLPQLSQPLITSKFVTFLPTPVWLPVSASPVDAAGQTSCPSSCSEEFSSWSTGERALEPTRALLLLGSNRLAVTQTEAGPESERSLGATAAGNEASSPVPAEGLEMPAGSSRQRSPETRSSPGAELQGTLLLASTQRPGKATPEAESVWLPTPSAASGQEWDVATITAQLLPRDWSTATFATGSEALLEQPGGSTAEPQTRPHESWTAVGHFFAKAAPEQSPTLPGSRAGLDHTAKTTEEVIIPGNFVPSKRAPSHRTTEATRAEQPPEDAQLSAGTPSPAAGQMEEAPSLFSHLGAALLLSPVGPTTHPVSRQDAPSTSSLSPGPTFLTLPFGLGWLPDGATAGPHASGATATFHSSTSPLMVSETALTGASTATGEEPRSQSPTEPYSTWYIKGGDPAESSSWPRQLPPKWQAEGGTSSSAASSPPGASVRHGESGGAPTGSGKGPHRPTTLPTKQAAREGSPREASVGAATEVAELSRRIPGRGDCADWLPSSTVPPVSSMAASFPTEGDVGSSAPTVDPELPSQMAPSSALASEAAGPMMGTTVMPGSASVTHQPWTFPGRPWQWEWGPRPRAPAEGSVRGATHSPYGPRGPLRTTAAPAESLPGSSEHTWTTSPASEPESVTRGGLLITGSRLSSATPDKALTQLVPAVPRGARPRAPQVFVVENQPPLLKATFLHIPCELVLAMEFSRSFRNPDTPEYQGLVLSINETVTPLFESLPGFQRLEVKTIRPGSVVVAFDALFLAEAPGLWAALNRSSLSDRLPSGLWVANASLLQSTTQERDLDLCSVLFACHAGFECVAGEDGPPVCTSVCHRNYCRNEGICTHMANHTPVCQCPVGSDFWFLGVRCDYKVTQQGLLGVAGGLLLSLVVVGAAVAGLVIRRVRMLLLEARADQTKSSLLKTDALQMFWTTTLISPSSLEGTSYRRFCRLDDVSAHYWSEPWLASAISLDNPAFSNSEELLHLQILDTACCSCQDNCVAPSDYCKQPQDPPCIGAAGQPSHWDVSSTSMNDPMIDSGKASEVSVSSWPMEPIQWSPFPTLHHLSRQQEHKAQRPHSYCEGMELVNLERSWTA